MDSENNSKEDSIFESPYYFKLGDAVDDVSHSYGLKNTAIASAKLLGKTFTNTAIFSGKLGWKIIKEFPNAVANQSAKKK